MKEADERSPVDPTSWVDYLQGAILRAPGPWWLSLALVWLAFILVEVILLQMTEGAASPGLTHGRQIVVWAGLAPYCFGLLLFLDRRAEAAILRLRPLIKAGSDWRVLSSSISNMPFWPPLLSALGGLVFFVLLHSVADVPATLILAGTTGATSWIRMFEGILFWMVVGAGVYHTIRQLRIIDHVYSDHVEISLLDQSPLYGLASVSAYTAIGLFIPVSLPLLVLPELSSDPTSIGLALGVFGLAVLTFLAPLYRLHLELDAEKDRRLSANSQNIEALVQRLYASGGSFPYEQVDQIHRSIEAFTLEKKIIDGARTWPWPAGAMRGTIAALLVPTMIWVIQRLLQTVFP